MKQLLLIALLSPFIALAQPSEEEYNIYSEYLKMHTAQSDVKKILFAVRTSTPGIDENGVLETIETSAAFVRTRADNTMYFTFRDVNKEVVTDTLWARVIENLKDKLKNKLTLKNRFSADLNISMMNDSRFHSYFGGDDYDENWERFHETYPMPSTVVQFSPISADGSRAVFYVARRCNPFCGNGSLVYFKKDNNQWKYLGAENIWNN